MEILENLSVIIASLTAIYGIFSWRFEMRGRRKYEIAENLLAKAYEFKDNINYVRMPLDVKGEKINRTSRSEESVEQRRALDRAYLATERFRTVHESLSEFYALKNRVSAVYGHEASEPIERLRGVAANVMFAIHQLPRTISGNASAGFGPSGPREIESAEEQEYLNAEKRALEKIAYYSFGQEDEIEIQIEAAISDLEKFCAPEIGSLHWWDKWKEIVARV